MNLDPKAMRKTVAVMVGGREMVFEAGWIAKQAAGAVMVHYGDTSVLITCQDAAPRPGTDFFPLTLEYREKTSAAGKIPGGFFKREGRPTTKEILTCRLLDRPLRPLFEDGYMDEVQIINSVYSADRDHDPDVAAMGGAAASVMLAGLPFNGPMAAVRVAIVGDEMVINPTYTEQNTADLDMVVAGTPDAITMVEAGANEVSEEVIIQALEYAHEAIKEICNAQLELAKLMGAERREWTPPEQPGEALVKECEAHYPAFLDAVKTPVKHERKEKISAAKQAAIEALLVEPENPSDEEAEAYAKRSKFVKKIVGGFAYKAIRDIIVDESIRVDGRKPDEIRQIVCEPHFLPRTHGSALFTRGETQALVTCTLGTAQDTQLIEGLGEKYEESFLLHYNFPPFCTGEARFIGSPKRREIGHGNLAERALRPMLPDQDVFPYTVRIVSDIMESNGSSSMATVCGGSLALFDAGAPVKAAVAGIAMGLIKEGDTVRILSDILGDEDHCGDMDFKVCGTRNGITALQMDIKISGLSKDIMKDALEQAKAGRNHILDIMDKSLEAPRDDISEYAPRYEVCKVPVDAIGMVIGPGGKHIRALQEETKSTISIDDDGTVKIFAELGDGAIAAKERIELMTTPVELNSYVQATVSSIKDFGCFADIAGKPGTEGMCHVSELSDEYVKDPNEVVELGQELTFKVIAIDPKNGKIKFSRKAVILEERGEEYVPQPPRPPRGRDGGRDGGRGGRGGGRGRDSRSSGRRERAPQD